MRGRALALLVLGVGATRDARAQGAPPQRVAGGDVVEIELEAPAGCAARALAQAELERLLGEARRTGERLLARGTIVEAGAGHYRLELQLERGGATSSRELEAKSCETLAEVAALLVALSHDPDAVERARAKQQAEPAPRVDAPAQVAVPEPRVAVEPAETPRLPPLQPLPPLPLPRLGFVGRAGFVGGIGDLPGPHPGVVGGAGLRLDEYLVELAVEFGGGSQSLLEDRPQAGATFQRVVGIARFCRDIVPFFDGPFPRREWELDLSGCAGLELGSMSGEGFGVSDPQRGEVFWAAPRLDVRAGIGLAGPLSLGLDVGVAFPVDPRRFVITGGDGTVLVVHTPAPAAGRLGLVAELNF